MPDEDDDRTVKLTALGAMVVARKDIARIWELLDLRIDCDTKRTIENTSELQFAIDDAIGSLAELKSHL